MHIGSVDAALDDPRCDCADKPARVGLVVSGGCASRDRAWNERERERGLLGVVCLGWPGSIYMQPPVATPQALVGSGGGCHSRPFAYGRPFLVGI